MYIHPALLLLVLILYLFQPSFQAWILAGDSAWYRPHLAWLLLIVLVFLMTRRKDRHVP